MKVIKAAIPFYLLLTLPLQSQELIFRPWPMVLGATPAQTPPEPTDVTPPTFELGQSDWFLEAGMTETISIQATDNSGTVIYSLPNGPSWLSYTNGALTANAPTISSSTVDLKAEDPSGNSTLYPLQINVSDTVDPIWFGVAELTLGEGIALSQVLDVNDAGSDITLSKLSGDAWISLDPSSKTLYGNPPSIGEYRALIEATDMANNSSAREYIVTVRDITGPAWASNIPRLRETFSPPDYNAHFNFGAYVNDSAGIARFEKVEDYSGGRTTITNPAVPVFSALIVMSGMEYPFSVRIRAIDNNGNASEATIEYVYF